MSGGDVVGTLTGQIEARFGMSMDQLRTAVSDAPTANPTVTEVVKWHVLLLAAQAALDRAEADLLIVLQTQHPDAAGPSQDLVSRVGEALTIRDGRALVVQLLLDPLALGEQDMSAERLAPTRMGRRAGPAVPATAPPRSSFAQQSARSAR
ncbi:hypothetical protein J7I94_02165 [Streptomyces sp. ISL-12]|nr:hypothetical protein [Streptomyces sp. ISL-12]